jgi:LDH2 family malate/lactate/ureidoglycolate dehydrogenase
LVPTGRVRAAARDGQAVPAGWLVDDGGGVVTDAAAFDRGEAHLRWLGGDPETGAYKGFGLGLAVEVLAALLPGAAFGPRLDALCGDGRPNGRDHDIGLFLCALAPDVLRPAGEFTGDADILFTTLLGCPPVAAGDPVRYPGWPEADRARRYRRDGVPLSRELFDELRAVAEAEGVPAVQVAA